MRKAILFSLSFLVSCLTLMILTPAWAAEKYTITATEIEQKYKAFYDDDRPLYKDLSYKKFLPPDVYSKLTYNMDSMKKLWEEVIGFRSPEVVGKIAPEIKPGTYTYKDKEKYMGLKELMWPDLYNRFNPGAPPHAGNFPEIKVVPTRQYYYALPIAEATKKYMGQTKLDSKGYIINNSYNSGYPFPRPSGEFKAQEVVYNWVKRYYNGENALWIGHVKGYTKNLKEDFDAKPDLATLRMRGRVLTEPYGWLDERAKKQDEFRGFSLFYNTPRDLFSSGFSVMEYGDTERFDLILMYISQIRRVRKMTATDAQDAVGGQDIIYEDTDGFNSKLSPSYYPYKFALIAEREYLVPAPQWDGSRYYSSKGLEIRNIEFERRPVYVVQADQTVKSHVYSKRLLYFDKETFFLYYVENYDWKGRRYRSCENYPVFADEMGIMFSGGALLRDFVDEHSGLIKHFTFPAVWLGRNYIDIGYFATRVK